VSVLRREPPQSFTPHPPHSRTQGRSKLIMGVVGEVGGRAAPRRDVADAVMRGAETTSYQARDVSDAGMTLSSLLSSILCSSHHLNDGLVCRWYVEEGASMYK